MEVWKSKLPPSVKVFAIMLLRDKLLTHEVMERRNMHVESHCLMCQNCSFEYAAHLFFLCPYATHVWYLVSSVLGYRIMQPQGTVWDIWLASRAIRGRRKKGEWVVHFVATAWTLWKQRNIVVFGGVCVQPGFLADRALQDCQLWSQYG